MSAVAIIIIVVAHENISDAVAIDVAGPDGVAEPATGATGASGSVEPGASGRWIGSANSAGYYRLGGPGPGMAEDYVHGARSGVVVSCADDDVLHAVAVSADIGHRQPLVVT